MEISALILQIRQYAPFFGGRVAGMAEFDPDITIANLQPPCAYVTPVADDAGDNENTVGIFQRVHETFAVIVCLDNTSDPRGQTAATQAFYDVRKYLWAALLGWNPPTEHVPTPIEYVSCDVLGKDERARAYFRYVFKVEVIIDDKDGFQPKGVDLIEIDVDTGKVAARFT
jgi:hypothetical protein